MEALSILPMEKDILLLSSILLASLPILEDQVFLLSFDLQLQNWDINLGYDEGCSATSVSIFYWVKRKTCFQLKA